MSEDGSYVSSSRVGAPLFEPISAPRLSSLSVKAIVTFIREYDEY